MATVSLSTNLASLVTAHKQTLHLIHRLQDLPIQPGSTSEADVRSELTSEIHQNLKDQTEDLELLKSELETYRNNSAVRRRSSEKTQEKDRLASTIAKLEEDLKSSRSYFRKAQLQAKRNAEIAKRKERELFLSENIRDRSNPPPATRRKAPEKLTQDELTLSASTDVTAALRRTHDLMQSELSRSHFAQETLEQSTAALSQLSESYTNLDTLLSSSRSLVSTLLRSQKSDTWYLETAFYILVGTICWLLFRRILYGPFWWLVWLPIKLLYRFTITALAATGILGAAGGSSTTLSTSTSLIIQRSATGGHPTIPPGHRRPEIVVGGGGKGAGWQVRMPEPNPSPSPGRQDGQDQKQAAKQPEGGEDKAQQEVKGTNVDDISEEERRRQEQIPRNPKKRMFEAPVENAKQEQRERDEL